MLIFHIIRHFNKHYGPYSNYVTNSSYYLILLKAGDIPTPDLKNIIEGGTAGAVGGAGVVIVLNKLLAKRREDEIKSPSR